MCAFFFVPSRGDHGLERKSATQTTRRPKERNSESFFHAVLHSFVISSFSNPWPEGENEGENKKTECGFAV